MAIRYYKTNSRCYHPSTLNKPLQKYKVAKTQRAVDWINGYCLGSNVRPQGVAYGVEETKLLSLGALLKKKNQSWSSRGQALF